MKRTLDKIIFWLKPDGEQFCEGKDVRKTKYFSYCIKYNSSSRLPFDCKYLSQNVDFPEQSACLYKEKW